MAFAIIKKGKGIHYSASLTLGHWTWIEVEIALNGKSECSAYFAQLGKGKRSQFGLDAMHKSVTNLFVGIVFDDVPGPVAVGREQFDPGNRVGLFTGSLVPPKRGIFGK